MLNGIVCEWELDSMTKVGNMTEVSKLPTQRYGYIIIQTALF